MRHLVVQAKPGMFYRWPANCGIWSWDDEIVVIYYYATADRPGQHIAATIWEPDVPQ